MSDKDDFALGHRHNPGTPQGERVMATHNEREDMLQALRYLWRYVDTAVLEAVEGPTAATVSDDSPIAAVRRLLPLIEWRK